MIIALTLYKENNTFAFLKIDNKNNSHMVLLKIKFYFVMPVYDEKWYKYSPGNVMIYYLIKHCYKNWNFILQMEKIFIKEMANEVKYLRNSYNFYY